MHSGTCTIYYGTCTKYSGTGSISCISVLKIGVFSFNFLTFESQKRPQKSPKKLMTLLPRATQALQPTAANGQTRFYILLRNECWSSLLGTKMGLIYCQTSETSEIRNFFGVFGD